MMDAIDATIVARIRQLFGEHLAEEVNQSKYDQRDIERVQRNDKFVWRFVEDRSGDKEQVSLTTLKCLVHCLAWRKERGVNDLQASDFPNEVISSGRVRVGWDAGGNFMVVDRIGLFRKNAEWNAVLSDLIAYDMERYDLPVGGALYLDVTGAGYASMDLQNAMAISELLTKYYPNTFTKVYMYGVPTIIRPFLAMVIGLLPSKYQKRVQVIDKQEANAQIKGLQVRTPEGCSSLAEVGKLRGISEKAIAREIKQQAWIKEQCAKEDDTIN